MQMKWFGVARRVKYIMENYRFPTYKIVIQVTSGQLFNLGQQSGNIMIEEPWYFSALKLRKRIQVTISVIG